MTNTEEALRKVIKAWEKLPAGNYSPREIQDWLARDMAPAINNGRKVLNGK